MVMFGKIDHTGSNNDQENSQYKGYDQLLISFFEHIADHVRRLRISSQAEQAQYPQQAQDTDFPQVYSQGKKQVKEERKDSDQVDQGPNRNHVFEPSPYRVFVFLFMVAA